MSYITRTSSTVMADQTCFNEAIARIGATATKNGAQLNVHYNGRTWRIQRKANGAYTCQVERSQARFVNEMFRALENAYQDIQRERREAEERERKRIAKLQEDLQKLTDQASFDGIKHEELELDRSQIQKELQASEQILSELQSKSAELEKSRESYISITKQQVEEKAKEGSWGLAAMQDDPNKRRTRIQLRRKVKN